MLRARRDLSSRLIASPLLEEHLRPAQFAYVVQRVSEVNEGRQKWGLCSPHTLRAK